MPPSEVSNETLGRETAELNDTAIWLSDPLLVSVSLFKERDNLTVVFQHRTFYPEVEKYFRGGR